PTRLSGEEIPCNERTHFAPQCGKPLPGLGLFTFRKFAFKRIEATDSLLVFRRAIEERDQGSILLRRVGVERQNLDQAAARLDLPALLLEHEPRGGRVRQNIDTVPKQSRTCGLQCSPDSHSQRRIAPREICNEQQPSRSF